MPTFPRIQEVSDSELNFCFRKLSKKDTTTKVKALDELAALFALRSADELAAVLPAWVRRIIIFESYPKSIFAWSAFIYEMTYALQMMVYSHNNSSESTLARGV